MKSALNLGAMLIIGLLAVATLFAILDREPSHKSPPSDTNSAQSLPTPSQIADSKPTSSTPPSQPSTPKAVGPVADLPTTNSVNVATKKKQTYELVATKTEKTRDMNVMELYAFGGEFDPEALKEFCRDKKANSPAKVFFFVVIFDDPANAAFPKDPFTAEFGLEDEKKKHIRAIYTYNKLNGYSELMYHEKNILSHIPVAVKI